MTDLLQGLNPAQREAVTTTEGFVRGIPGAGSGTTPAISTPFTASASRFFKRTATPSSTPKVSWCWITPILTIC